MNELYTEFEKNNNLQTMEFIRFIGICKKCGGKVYETNCEQNTNIPENINKKYRSFCITDKCQFNKWNYTSDYYNSKENLNKLFSSHG